MSQPRDEEHNVQLPEEVYQMGSALPRNISTSAHDWGQVLMFEGQSGSFFRSYTHLVKDELTDIPMKASTQMAQTINEVGIEQLKRMF